MTLVDLATLATAAGLAVRGAFHPQPPDNVPPLPDGRSPATLVLLGWIGGEQWPAFAGSPEANDGVAHPLDRWSKRVVDDLAVRAGAAALYPFGGPPYLPFQRWAKRAEPVFPSPLGLFIHADHGLWHSYRGALALAERLDLPAIEPRLHPCETCIAKPCLTTCPVSAFQPGAYDVDACVTHVKSTRGESCRLDGCLARRACPVGRSLHYGQDQASFYMRAFVAAH